MPVSNHSTLKRDYIEIRTIKSKKINYDIVYFLNKLFLEINTRFSV